MRAKVSKQERINNRLHRELSQILSGVENAGSNWRNLSNNIIGTLQVGNQRINDSINTTNNASLIQDDIKRIYLIFKEIELANKRIRACNDKIYYDFASYNAVRKIVQAMLNNIEVSFVSNETIKKAVEIKHLQLPDYWLTCALLSILAWQNDDKEMAQATLERAFKLNKKDTCMFYFAFHIRLGKDDVAIKWFAEYITCARNGEDQENILLMFSIINKTLVNPTNAALMSRVNEFINDLIKQDLANNNFSENDVILKTRRYLLAFKVNESMDYPLLKTYVVDSQDLRNLLNLAKTNVKTLDFILKTVNVTAEETNDFLNEFIDHLIAKTNESEKKVKREIKRNEFIIAQCGKLDKNKEEHLKDAKKSYNEWLTHQVSEFSIINEMIDWVYCKDDVEVNPKIIKMMFILTKKFNEEATKRNVNRYRKKFTRTHDIKINEYESTANFANVQEEESKIKKYFDAKAEKLIARAASKRYIAWFVVAALALVGCIYFANPTLLVGTVLGLVGGAGSIFLSNKKKQRIIADCDKETKNTIEIFKQIVEEFKKYEAEFLSFDKYYDDIEIEFAKI